MSDAIDSGIFPLEDSLCYRCAHRCSRVFIPIDYDAYGINLDDFDLEDDEPLEIEQHTCLVLGEDLDCVMRACSKFLDVDQQNTLITNFVF